MERVRSRIQNNQLTQAGIGKALGIKQSAVSYLLKGKTKLSLEQFLLLSELVGVKAQQMIADAEAGLTESRPMPKALEDVQYKSVLHLLAYCAAVRPVSPAKLTIDNRFSLDAARAALDDLVSVGVLVKNGETYVQKQANVTYVVNTKEGMEKRQLRHLEIHRISQENWLKNIDNKAYRSKRFNYIITDYFTPSQIREVEEHLWRAYEKIVAFQRENMASSYSAEDFALWQAHFMLLTPLEAK